MIMRFTILFLSLVFALTCFGQKKELNRLAESAAKAVQRHQFMEADSLYGKYVLCFQQNNLTKDFEYSEILAYLARRALQLGQQERAITLQKEIVDIRRTAPDCTFLQWASAMSDLGMFYSQKGDYSSAIKTGQQALDMLKQKVGEKHQFYNISLANLASFYSARGWQGDYDKAVQLNQEALRFLKKKSFEYASSLNSMVVYYTQVGDLLNANKISEKALKLAKKRMKKDGQSYATILNNQSVQLANLNNYYDAIEFALKAKESLEQAESTNTFSYAKVLTNTATFYSHIQNYKEAANLLETALPILEETVSKTHPDYIRAMSDLSAVYKAKGDLERADVLANQSEELSTSLTGNDNLKYAQSLSKQASIFASNGNFFRAIENEEKAFDLFEKRKDSISMAQSLGNIASYLAYDGQPDSAYKVAQQSLGIFEKRQKISTYYAQALNNTSILYFNGEQYDKAIQYGRQSWQMYQDLGDTITAIYAQILANNALYCFVSDSLPQAITLAEHALQLQTKMLGEEHPDNVPLLYNLAVYYNKAGKRDKAEFSYEKAIALQSDLIRTNFLHLTSQEREKYWNQHSYVFKYAPMLAFLDPQNEEMATIAYNSQLFTKGILLNSDIDFRNLLKNAGNQVVLDKYDQFEALRLQKENYYRLPTDQRTDDINEIINQMYQLERFLVNGCKEYGSFTENLHITTAQICEQLEEDEVAIEFATTYVHGRGNTYLAFVLHKNDVHPRQVRLFSDDELEDIKYGEVSFLDAVQSQILIDSVYNDARFGMLLWQPLIKELEGVHRIFFSPSALLYQLGIEYMLCDETHRINELYEIYRVSSTKLLVQRASSLPEIKSATVYGGLNYDMSLMQLQEQHNMQSSTCDDIEPLLAMVDFDMTRTLDSLTMRGSVGFLPNTLHEAESVGEQLMQRNIPTTIYMGNEGTEESFKALAGKSQHSIIHIATHGFYFSESSLKQHRLLFINEHTENLNNPLNYSGLLLSGANYILKGGRLPDNLEDGILTANEVAQLDLGQTELVVLSACQTGVGDVREDGVFGIQRGFKKAGVKTLLMSLWSVSDSATDIMMTKFYENMMNGLPKQKAFQKAQNALKESGYDAPFFWASFIMLDAF